MRLLSGVIIVLLLFACNQKNDLPQSLCDCFDVQMDMMDEVEGKELNDEQLAEIEKKYESKFNSCDKLAKDFDDKMKGLTKEEQIEAQDSLKANCEAYQEYIDQNEAMTQQQMQGQENPFEDMSEDEILEYLKDAADAELEQLEEK